MSDRCDFHIVTGGPGSGKSSLITALGQQGFKTMPEAGRAIIRDQVAIGGTALPWADREAFAALMLGWELRSWHEAHGFSGPVMFDRGLIDVIGYLRLCDLPVPASVSKAAELFRYNAYVFIAPPWRDIFATDAERKQDFAEAQATHAAMVEVYTALGYTLVPLPLSPVPERLAFVRAHLAERNNR